MIFLPVPALEHFSLIFSETALIIQVKQASGVLPFGCATITNCMRTMSLNLKRLFGYKGDKLSYGSRLSSHLGYYLVNKNT